MTTRSPAAPPPPLRSLPVAVHAAPPRACDADAARFEAVLNAADAAVVASLAAQRGAGAAGSAATDSDDADARLCAVLEAVSSATDGRTPPPASAGRAELVHWTVGAITTLRMGAVHAEARRVTRAQGIDPGQIAACYELICKLNTAMGGAPPA